MTTARARHRATARPFHWASRSVVATAAVPVGALAGCVAAAASSSQPMLGLAGMTVAAVPLALHAWHTRRAERAIRPVGGRHAQSAVVMDEIFSTLSPTGELSTPARADREWGIAALIPSPRAAAEASWAAREARMASMGVGTSIDLSRHDDLDSDEDLEMDLEMGLEMGLETDDDLHVALPDAELDLAVWPTAAERDSEIAKLRRLWDASVPASTQSPVQASGIA